MTGGSDIRLKIRAVFLAFVMVVSVFGATVAFSGSAAAENPGDNPEATPDQLEVSLTDGSGNVNATFSVVQSRSEIQVDFTNGTTQNISFSSGNSAKAIQFAIDNATGSNSTVRIGPGTYNSSITIGADDPAVTLEGINNPVIVGDGINTGSQPHAAIFVEDNSAGSAPNATGVTITGLTIQNPDGNYGIYAGQGGGGANITGLTITENTIEDVGTNVDGSPLAGAVAGVYVRADYDTITISDNTIQTIFSPDSNDNAAGISLSSFIGSKAFNGSPAANDSQIERNTITNITSSDRTKGISVSGEFDGVNITQNSVSGIERTNGRVLAISLTENPGKPGSDIDGDGTDERIGPRNFIVQNNDVSQLTGSGISGLFVGGYEDLGDNHEISTNDIEGPVQRFNANQSNFTFADADGLVFTDNTVTASSSALVVGKVSGVTGNTLSSTSSGTADAQINAPQSRADITPSDIDPINSRVQFLLNNNDLTTTNPYAVEVTPTDVTVGNTETVEGQILGRDSNNPRKSSVGFLIVDASNDTADAADSFDGDVVTNSSTNSNSFSTLVQFSEVGNFGVVLDSETGGPRANVSSLYAINNFSTDPTSPTFENSTSVSGQIVNGAGDGVDVGTITVIRPNDNTGSSTSTTSDGSFQFTVSGVDAGEFGLGTSSDEAFETFTVDPQQANVTLETAGGNNAGFSEDYTITVQDGSGNAFDFTNNYDGYVNVTGEFNSVSPTTDAVNNGGVDSDNDGVTDYYRVVPNSTGVIEFTATPNASADSVTATLENNGNNEGVGNTTAATNDGLEEVTGPTSYDAPDQVGSASAAISSAGNLTVNLVRPGDGDITATQSETIEIEALGADGQPADGSSGNDLANVTISLSGPGVDAEQTLTSDNSANFTVTADQAGTVTADVTAVENNGTEFTETVNVTVTGDKIVSVTPTDPDIDNTSDVTVEVTNADDTPVNSREVLITSQGNATFEVGSVTGVQQIAIDGANNQVVVDTDTDGQVEDASGSSTVVDNSLVVNNGLYTATNVTFSSPGDINVTVDRDTTAGASVRAQSVGAIATQGVDEYEIQSDISPLVASADEQVNFTVTDSAGAEVNGSTLNEFLGNGEFTVTQDGGTDVTTDTPETVDTDSDGTDDTIRVNVRPINASQAVNVSVATADGGQTGDSNVSVAAPQVNVAGLSSASGSLTERVATELTVTVENPRTGDRLSGTDLQAQVINGTAEFSSVSDFSSDENSTTALNVGDGNATFDVLAYDGTAEDFAVTISAKSSDSETDYFGDTTLDVEPMQVSVSPQEIVIGNQPTIDIGVQDANGNALANRRVDIAGAGVSIENAATDSQGTVTVTAQPQATGTIDIAVDSDAEIESGGATPPRVGSGSDPAATIEANISAVSSTQLAVNAGTLSPDTVSDNSTVQHTLEFTVEDLSADGNADDFTITLPASVSATNVADVTVTDGDGNNVAISSSASLADANGGTNNQLTFSVSPDSGNTSVVTVNSTFSVEFPDVQNDTTADINATVSDSTRGTAGATVATVTIQDQNATQQQPVATVTFDDKTVQNGTSNITVESAEFGGGEYNIVVHQASDTSGDGTIQAGEIGTKIGESDALPNGTASNVTVDIGKQVASNDNVSQLTQNQTLVAMLHTTNTSDGDNITHASPITRGGTPVFDEAEITVEQQPQGLDRFDRNGDGSISGTEVLGAIDAFENGQIGGTDVLQVIEAFEQGTVPSQLN